MSAAPDADRRRVLVVDRARWRSWLAEYGDSAAEVWLVIPHAGRATAGDGGPIGAAQGIGHREAIEEAICAGWIDSHARRHDGGSMLLRFSPRGPRSTWCRSNRELVDRLEAAGLMTPAGRDAVDRAKRSGAWDVLAEAQDGIVPDDLRARLDADETAGGYVDASSRSARRAMLEWVARAKRQETRQRRIARVVACAAARTTPPELGLRTPARPRR